MLKVLIACGTLVICNILLEITELPVVWSIRQRRYLLTLRFAMVWHNQMVLLNLKQFLLDISFSLALRLIILLIWAALAWHILVQKMFIESFISIIGFHLAGDLKLALRTASNLNVFVGYLCQIESKNRFWMILLFPWLHLMLYLLLPFVR